MIGCLCGWLGCAADRMGEEDDLGRPPIGSACSQDGECGTGRRCIGARCAPDYGDCLDDNDCQNDTYCACPPELDSARCACVPWGNKPRTQPFDPRCAGAAFPVEAFRNPVLKCQWPADGLPVPYKDILSTPVVIDLDRDGTPEIIFVAGYPGGGHLIAISGRDCTVRWDRAVNASGCMHIAAADLDGDGRIEIVAHAGGLSVFNEDGLLLAQTAEPGGAFCARDYPPAIANVDGVGEAEIIAGAGVFRYEAGPMPKITRLWNKNFFVEEGHWATIAIAQDLDGDGKPEVISGRYVFDGVTGNDKTKPVMKNLGGGYPAIGDFNADGKPDIVLVRSLQDDQRVSIVDYANDRLLWAEVKADKGWGGPPTVADFDGDKKPDIGTASARFYYTYALDCLQSPRPAKCLGREDGVLWQSETQDESSGSTGSAVFDFNGDGQAEVVYRDECWLRVYSGKDGKKLFAAPVTSGTIVELPVVADTDGDGHAEIVISADSAQGNGCKVGKFPSELGISHPGASFGIKVFVDPKNRWVGSRKIWNQHSYHVTNIEDDGKVPTVEPPNHTLRNNYRQNVQGTVGQPDAHPDGTGKIGLPVDVGDCVTLFRPSGQVCNRGAVPLRTAYPAAFYVGDPRQMGAKWLCTGYTNQRLEPGACAAVDCEWRMPTPPPYDLWMQVGDDGKGSPKDAQCKSGNDLAHLPLARCGANPG